MSERRYADLGAFSNGLAPVARNDKWGYINTSGEEAIGCQFSYAEPFYVHDYAIVGNENNKQGIIDSNGNCIVKQEYYSIKVFKNSSLIALRESDNTNWCVINPKNRQVLGEFRQAGNSVGSVDYGSNGLVPVKNNEGRWGLLNEDGALTVPFIYDEISCYDKTEDYFLAKSGGKLRVQDGHDISYYGGKQGLIKPNGEVVIGFKYDELYYAAENRIIAGKGQHEERKYGVVTLSGKTILPRKYSYMLISDGIICFQDTASQKWGWADLNGKILVEPQFFKNVDYDCLGFSNGLMRVHNKNFTKVGYVDKKGELVIPYKFAEHGYRQEHNLDGWVGDFHDGLAHYNIGADDKRGWIDKNGDIVISPIYSTLETRFGKDGLIPVWLGNDGFYIDRTGTRRLPDIIGFREDNNEPF